MELMCDCGDLIELCKHPGGHEDGDTLWFGYCLGCDVAYAVRDLSDEKKKEMVERFCDASKALRT